MQKLGSLIDGALDSCFDLRRAVLIQPGIKMFVCIDSLCEARLALSGLPKREPANFWKVSLAVSWTAGGTPSVFAASSL
jgi:hypothetical protein